MTPAIVPIREMRGALHGLALPKREGRVSVSDASETTRFVYQGAPDIIGTAFGVALPAEPCRATKHGVRAALWLGPDEWLLLLPITQQQEATEVLHEAIAGKAASLVDVSHRNAGLIVDGPAAAFLLNTGCPLDLDIAAFPIDMCARTLFSKTEIVLWRTAAETFRIEVWRSFAPYVVGHLGAAIHGIG